MQEQPTDDDSLESPQQSSNTDPQSPLELCNESDNERNTPTPIHRPRPTRKNTLTDEVLRSVNDHFKRPRNVDDRFDVYGKNIGMKLRELPKQQRILAEKIINETLFLAEMGSLTMSHSVSSNFLNTNISTQPHTQIMQTQYQPQTQTQSHFQFPITRATPIQSQFQAQVLQFPPPPSENSAASYLRTLSDDC